MQRKAHDVDEMSFQELDSLRHLLRVSRKDVCAAAEINPTTYARWSLWARGEPGGSKPHPRSLRALRDALKQRVSQAAA